jgi:hypothetical protein
MSKERRRDVEIAEAVKDRLEWKRHVREKKTQEDPDLYYSWGSAISAAKKLLQDFSSNPDSSVITVFSIESGKFKIDAISDYPEFELHRSEYESEDVLALVYFKEGDPFVKKMKSKVN